MEFILARLLELPVADVEPASFSSQMNSEVSLVLDEEASQFHLTCWLITKRLHPIAPASPCAQRRRLVEYYSYRFAFAAKAHKQP